MSAVSSRRWAKERPRRRNPEPASKTMACGPFDTSTQAVSPPNRLAAGPEAETLPRVPQNRTVRACSDIDRPCRFNHQKSRKSTGERTVVNDLALPHGDLLC